MSDILNDGDLNRLANIDAAIRDVKRAPLLMKQQHAERLAALTLEALTQLFLRLEQLERGQR